MEPRGSIPHSQGLYNSLILIMSRINPILRIDNYFFKNILILPSHLRLGLPKGRFPIHLPVKIMKALLPPSVLANELPILIF